MRMGFIGLPFVLTANYDVGENHYRIYTLSEDDMDVWLEMLADEYIRLRTGKQKALEKISTEGIDIVDTSLVESRLRSFEKRRLQASVPRYQPGNFSVLRSDFGELLNYVLLEDYYRTVIFKKSIESRRATYQIERGIDAIGVESKIPIELIISEVKVSDENASPPQVVDRQQKDCLRIQHLHHITKRLEIDGTFDKIADLFKNVADKETAQFLKQVEWYLFQEDWRSLHYVACSALVRPQDKYSKQDFGSFQSRPGDYAPAYIRFLIISVPYDIDTMVRKWDSVITQRMEKYL